jgi:hypothetical protein
MPYLQRTCLRHKLTIVSDPLSQYGVPHFCSVQLDAVRCARASLEEDFRFPLCGDEGLERGDDLVATGHDGIHFGLGQIVFGFIR